MPAHTAHTEVAHSGDSYDEMVEVTRWCVYQWSLVFNSLMIASSENLKFADWFVKSNSYKQKEFSQLENLVKELSMETNLFMLP